MLENTIGAEKSRKEGRKGREKGKRKKGREGGRKEGKSQYRRLIRNKGYGVRGPEYEYSFLQ